MATAADIVGSTRPDGHLIGELRTARGVIRAHPTQRGWEARVFTAAAGYGAPHTAPEMAEAIRWVEQELLRLANDAAV